MQATKSFAQTPTVQIERTCGEQHLSHSQLKDENVAACGIMPTPHRREETPYGRRIENKVEAQAIQESQQGSRMMAGLSDP